MNESCGQLAEVRRGPTTGPAAIRGPVKLFYSAHPIFEKKNYINSPTPAFHHFVLYFESQFIKERKHCGVSKADFVFTLPSLIFN